MNGQMVRRRSVRTNWAERKASVATTSSEEERSIDSSANDHQCYEKIYNATDSNNTTVYLGNLGVSPSKLISGLFALNIAALPL